jgi:hypothetical protein
MPPNLQGKNREIRKCVAKFRTGSHWLKIQRGRFTKPQTERENRLCKKCDLGLVEDEVHVVFVCPLYEILKIIQRCNELEQCIQLSTGCQISV